MKVRSSAPGRPKDPRNDDRLKPLVDEIDTAETVVLAAVHAHAADPSQRHTVDLLEAQMRVASLRAHLARACGDDKIAAKESELVIKLAKSRDDACKLLWGDELREIHAAVTRTGGIASAIAAELAEELSADPEDCTG